MSFAGANSRKQKKTKKTREEKRKELVSFANALNKSLFELTRTHHRITTAYHPAGNGMVRNDTKEFATTRKVILDVYFLKRNVLPVFSG